MSKILVVPPKALSPSQRANLSRKGIIVIETDEPDKVRVIDAETNMDSSDWFMAALGALTTKNPTYKSEYFVNELYARLKEKEKLPKEQEAQGSDTTKMP